MNNQRPVVHVLKVTRDSLIYSVGIDFHLAPGHDPSTIMEHIQRIMQEFEQFGNVDLLSSKSAPRSWGLKLGQPLRDEQPLDRLIESIAGMYGLSVVYDGRTTEAEILTNDGSSIFL